MQDERSEIFRHMGAPAFPAGQLLPIDQVYANPDQPRKHFDPEALSELAASIHRQGVLQPVTVVLRPSTLGSWMLVMGERRYRASRIAAKTEIPAFVRDLSDDEIAEQALIENLIREDLGIVEEARAYAALLKRGYTVESLGEKLGLLQPWRIQERLNVLKLEAALLVGLEKGAISPSQATELSRLSHEGQFRLWRAIGAGKCPTYNALRMTATAILDQENQVELFRDPATVTAVEKAALTKITRFVARAGRLLGALNLADVSILKDVPKPDAALAAERLGLLERMCRELKDVLLANAAKQELVQMKASQ
jgi:ParB family chromosome partitioning protein